MKILAGTQNIGVLQKYRRMIESWRASKSPRLAKISAEKGWRPAYYLGSAESPTADFLLDWLKSSRSDPHRCTASQTCRPQVRSQPSLLCFYGQSLSRTVPAGRTGPALPKYTRKSKLLAAAHIFTTSCENSKLLSRLLSVLSLSRKFVHDHCCCPKSAIILTVSKTEAILDFWRGCQSLSRV
jgi:hypothetical protein